MERCAVFGALAERVLLLESLRNVGHGELLNLSPKLLVFRPPKAHSNPTDANDQAGQKA
jgi:hypothetical protein